MLQSTSSGELWLLAVQRQMMTDLVTVAGVSAAAH